jgi:acetoacetyl-CoA synthetase
MPEPLWRPSPERIAASNMMDFIKSVRNAYSENDTVEHGDSAKDVVDYESLYQWSITHPELFWEWLRIQIGLDLRDDTETVRGVDRMSPPDPELGPWWFKDLQLNFASKLLFHDFEPEGSDSDWHQTETGPAIIAWNEDGRHAWVTWPELRYRVNALRIWLAEQAVTAGDRVVGFMPNIPETVIAMLAATSLGAVWSSCSPDFGVQGVLDRFGQIEPKVLFVADGYQYNGKYIDSLARVREFIPQLPSIEQIVVVEYLKHEPDLGGLGSAHLLRNIIGFQPELEPAREFEGGRRA